MISMSCGCGQHTTDMFDLERLNAAARNMRLFTHWPDLVVSVDPGCSNRLELPIVGDCELRITGAEVAERVLLGRASFADLRSVNLRIGRGGSGFVEFAEVPRRSFWDALAVYQDQLPLCSARWFFVNNDGVVPSYGIPFEFSDGVGATRPLSDIDSVQMGDRGHVLVAEIDLRRLPSALLGLHPIGVLLSRHGESTYSVGDLARLAYVVESAAAYEAKTRCLGGLNLDRISRWYSFVFGRFE
jgi:hypothetical protein